LEEAKEFVELWNLDYPLQSLTARLQNAQFGWINKQEEMIRLSLSIFFIQGEWTDEIGIIRMGKPMNGMASSSGAVATLFFIALLSTSTNSRRWRAN
jgi:hypothetical protein